MKRIIVATAITAMIATSLSSGAALAQPGPDHRQAPPHHGRYQPPPPPPPVHAQPHKPQPHVAQPHKAPPHMMLPPKGQPHHVQPPKPQPPHHAQQQAGKKQPGPGWRKGDRLSPNHYRRADVIARPQAHHLPPPPKGHEWVRVDRDAVMVAVGTGLVIYGLQNIFR